METLQAIDIAVPLLIADENFRATPYDDQTGRRVTCRPDGNLTWLYGLNLEVEGTPELGLVILRWKLGKLLEGLIGYDWYMGCNAPRQAVLLCIAYNVGFHGLLDFASMLHFVTVKDWPSAKAQCHVKNPRLKPRYDRLADILLSGVI